MPCDYRRYPANWKAIRASILERARNRCERCGVPDHAVLCDGRPTAGNEAHELAASGELTYREASAFVAEMKDIEPQFRWSFVVLTIAHIGAPHPDGRPGDKHDKMDVRPENLQALCQRCHLAEDMAEHVANARATRHRKLGIITMELPAGAPQGAQP